MMFFNIASLTLLSALGLTSATPLLQRALTGCDVSYDVIPLGDSGLTAPPAGQAPEFIALGVGTQNYSCGTSGTFASIGALATLYDASCVFKTLDGLNGGAPITTISGSLEALGPYPLVLGHHFFINNPTGAAGISPTFDFRSDSEKGNPEGFVVTSKTEDVPSPVDPADNVDWLQLTAIPGQGELASTVYRIFTILGQPPASCNPGATIEVPYAANYWFFK